MKYFKSSFIQAIIVLTVVLTSGCSKLIEVDMPIGSTDKDKIFSTEGGAESAVRGMYGYWTVKEMTTHIGAAKFTGLSGDELVRLSYMDTERLYFENALTSDRGLDPFWTHPYHLIYQANNIIDNLSNSTKFSKDKVDGFLAEAKFVRALMYFNLVNLMGDVPLLLTAEYTKNVNVTRSPSSEIYKQIEDDLIFAKQFATHKTLALGDRNRVTSYAASGLLAQVYLFQKKYALAEAEANEVINSNEFVLESIDKVFLKESKETILSLANWLNNPVSAFSIGGPGLTNVHYRLSDQLIAKFESNDLRLQHWGRAGIDEGLGSIAPFKYKFNLPSEANGKVENKQIIRYAEILLIRAEARNELDKPQLALHDMDLVRNRAGLLPLATRVPALNKEQIRDLLFKERATELFAEGSHRWFDIKRRGDDYAVNYMKSIKPSFTKTDLYYPIPLGEITKNPQLVQNEGY
ncbi:RagB/SusD family nutrient uptake outer membrane protein [Sphingobacterium sp. DK4209]|uniref:RagB/SusD family nutrient uptake outer membrane protein n=1 Tax=Sphingobacterium zhuxiongii TaxID=2662364 RepID=A0A5Q0Q8P1_9SPHI|nr:MULTISPECIES: RagB/SusD family nutrient uptake outer membrane protein [unclassified Sphingobacterium]MVZ65340.1 RagB/SusD family nutrient uptake outer membrane protein [Sphingobacterium sp. DK4209]QGA26427.1 RagB/SusD family nutrient uptake outer membrane protein [Sphingobacterium sp. dk4302]